jgi:hypothetical protein
MENENEATKTVWENGKLKNTLKYLSISHLGK